jgi:voltage-gated potassium channel
MDRRVLRRIVYIGALIAFTMIVGTSGFRLLEGYTLFDAFYMTLITITTVGYQEVRPLTQTGRIFNSFLIFFGVSAMFFAVGAMTQTIIELHLENRYGKRRKRRAIMHLEDHFIVCGFGRVGRNAAFELQRTGAPFLVIDRNELAGREGRGVRNARDPGGCHTGRKPPRGRRRACPGIYRGARDRCR